MYSAFRQGCEQVLRIPPPPEPPPGDEAQTRIFLAAQNYYKYLLVIWALKTGLSLLVLVFGIPLDWLPVSGWGDIPGDKILPAVTLGAGYAAYIARLGRAGMLEVLSQDYIRTARAKGLPQWQVVLKHSLRGGMIPVVAFLGPAFAGLLAGSFVVETIFQIPGLGRFYVQAAFNRDYTMILGTTVFLSVLIVFFNLLSDILAAWMNPRLRAQFGGQ